MCLTVHQFLSKNETVKFQNWKFSGVAWKCDPTKEFCHGVPLSYYGVTSCNPKNGSFFLWFPQLFGQPRYGHASFIKPIKLLGNGTVTTTFNFDINMTSSIGLPKTVLQVFVNNKEHTIPLNVNVNKGYYDVIFSDLIGNHNDEINLNITILFYTVGDPFGNNTSQIDLFLCDPKIFEERI